MAAIRGTLAIAGMASPAGSFRNGCTSAPFRLRIWTATLPSCGLTCLGAGTDEEQVNRTAVEPEILASYSGRART
jgi:hypothetical protein